MLEFCLRGKNYVRVKKLCVRKKNFTPRGGGPIGMWGGGPIGIWGGPILWLRSSRYSTTIGSWGPDTPGGNFRRWFRIRCQSFNRTYGCGDTVTGNFAEEIFPTRTFDISGGSFGCWHIIRCQNSKIMHRHGDIQLLSQNPILSHAYHVIITLICRHTYTYAYIHTYTQVICIHPHI